MIKAALSNRLFVNLAAIGVIVAGFLATLRMPREQYPVVETPVASVDTALPGASGEEIERLVTIPIERVLRDIEGVKTLNSASYDGHSKVWVVFEPSIDDVDRAMTEVNGAVSQIRGLPEDALSPLVRRSRVRVPVLTLAIQGSAQPHVLQEVSSHVIRSLEHVSGVSDVADYGLRPQQLTIEADPDRLQALNLPLPLLRNRIQGRLANQPLGSADGPRRARIVRGMTAAATPEALEGIVLRAGDVAGSSLRLGDVASVREHLGTPAITARVNGNSGVVLHVFKSASTDIVSLNQRLRQRVEELRAALPGNVQLELYGDSSAQVVQSLNTLYGSVAAGLVLVIAALWAALGWRQAVAAALGLPLALGAALAVMQSMGITLNVVSLAALILCTGIIVDDAIIFIENIDRHLAQGVKPLQAAYRGTKEVLWPVTSSTLTTCAAFLPLLSMSGLMGEFFAIIPRVVAVALVSSLIESVFVLPVHMVDLHKRRRQPRPHKPHLFGRFSSGYEGILKRLLRRSGWTVVCSYGLVAAIIAHAVTTKEVTLIEQGDVDTFEVQMELPTDASRDRAEALALEVERRILALPHDDIHAVVTLQGITGSPSGPLRADHAAMVAVHLVPPDQRSAPGAGRRLMHKASKMFDDILLPHRISVVPREFKPSMGPPIKIRLEGADVERLVDNAEELVHRLQSTSGAHGASHSFQPGKKEIQIRVDEDRAADRGISPTEVNEWVAAALGSVPVGTVFENNQPLNVFVQLPQERRTSIDQLQSLPIQGPNASSFPLRDVATLVEDRAPAEVRRHNGQRQVSVTAHVHAGFTPGGVLSELEPTLRSMQAAQPDIKIDFGGEHEHTQESLSSLAQASILSGLAIFAILAAQFRSVWQPLIVMAAIPLALAGVATGFLISDAPIGLATLVGVLGMTGIVVNDSLVLIDFINRRRREGHSLEDSISSSSRDRLRPILLTSVTTIVGLLPLALAGHRAPMLSPMAGAIVWGLTFSTVLILVVVPCLYRLGYRKEGKQRTTTPPPVPQQRTPRPHEPPPAPQSSMG